jgi:hypothetical protein
VHSSQPEPLPARELLLAQAARQALERTTQRERLIARVLQLAQQTKTGASRLMKLALPPHWPKPAHCRPLPTA